MISVYGRTLTNQFGALVGDLHGPDKARAARAKSIFEGLLGRKYQAGQNLELQYSVRLIGKPTDSMEIDSYLFGRDDNEAVKALFSNDKPAFKGRSLNGTSIEPLTNEVIQKRVEDAVEELFSPDPECIFSQNTFGMRYSQTLSGNKTAPGSHRKQDALCNNKFKKKLANIVLALQGTPSPVPISNRHTDVAPGGIIALLVRKKELEEYLKTDIQTPLLEVWVHEAEKPNSATLRFSDPQTKAVKPQRIALREFSDSNKCIKSSKPHGELCFIWVPLRLEAISEYSTKN